MTAAARRGGGLLVTMAWLLPLAAAVAIGAQLHAQRDTDELRAASRARDDIRVLVAALLTPRPGGRAMPTTADGLDALVADDTLAFVPPDPWGRPYQFRNPGTSSAFEVYSLGPDGVQSSDDIVSWNLYGGR
ncbi:type II secretion system protein GspG [Pseudothauera rhizosphaerae]|nr:type II secretion system protein GspG [Pseudothauera rhizosphaerae]